MGQADWKKPFQGGLRLCSLVWTHFSSCYLSGSASGVGPSLEQWQGKVGKQAGMCDIKQVETAESGEAETATCTP